MANGVEARIWAQRKLAGKYIILELFNFRRIMGSMTNKKG